MITIYLWLFVLLCIFAFIGLLFFIPIMIYLFFGILDLTYHERHKRYKDNHNDCPDKIER